MFTARQLKYKTKFKRCEMVVFKHIKLKFTAQMQMDEWINRWIGSYMCLYGWRRLQSNTEGHKSVHSQKFINFRIQCKCKVAYLRCSILKNVNKTIQVKCLFIYYVLFFFVLFTQSACDIWSKMQYPQLKEKQNNNKNNRVLTEIPLKRISWDFCWEAHCTVHVSERLDTLSGCKTT